MKRVIIILISVFMLNSLAFGIERKKTEIGDSQAPVKIEKVTIDTGKGESPQPNNPGAKQKQAEKKKFDDFIDRDGNGIDDRAEAKKKNPPPKPKPSPERLNSKPRR
jgi:preprotein translocase subunit SecG